MDTLNCTEYVYEIYDTRWLNSTLFIGGVLIITTITNMSILCTIRKTVNNIKNNFLPPVYK